MAKGSERTRVMKENFMTLHNAGYTIPQIAEQNNLSEGTVYRYLQEIADANQVSRESLLQVVRMPTEQQVLRREAEHVKVNVQELRAGFQKAGNIIDLLIGIIDGTLEKENELLQEEK